MQQQSDVRFFLLTLLFTMRITFQCQENISFIIILFYRLAATGA